VEDLDLTIEAWLDRLDNNILPKGQDERIEAFMILLKTLKDRGGKKESVTLVRSKVLIRCTNPRHDRRKLKIWKNILEGLFNTATSRIWADKEFSKLTDEETKPEKLKITPQAPKPDKTEEEEEEVPRFGKELDRSIFKDPLPVTEIDSELSQMLGFDSDE